ncbi:MAG: porin family protein [Pseudobacter sp.]|uniref:porin family protein n=1 Tax=Pseudobacter sp. TaxID=2045420 RepID=UPI003F802FB8
MKRIFLLLAFAGTFAAANAQTKIGLKGGLNVADWGGDDADNVDAKIGFHVGGFANFKVGNKFSVQPELTFSTQGGKVDAPGDDAKIRFNYINIPVMLKYEIAPGLNAQVGPQFGFAVTRKTKQGDVTVDRNDDFKGFDLGVGLGASYEFPSSPFGIDARYVFGLSRLDDNGDAKIFNRVFQLGVTYALWSGK